MIHGATFGAMLLGNGGVIPDETRGPHPFIQMVKSCPSNNRSGKLTSNIAQNVVYLIIILMVTLYRAQVLLGNSFTRWGRRALSAYCASPEQDGGIGLPPSTGYCLS